MRKYISLSDKSSFLLTGMALICYCLIGCGMQAHTPKLSSKEGYLISTGDQATEQDIRWAKYLYKHLKSRANDGEMVVFNDSKKELNQLIIQINPSLESSFKIERQGNKIKLIAPNNEKMLWLQYQVIKKISDEDARIEGSDLPPAILNLKDTCGSFAFKYQDIYSPTGLNVDYAGIAGLNPMDNSWGIWGHNLHKVLGDDLKSLYATVERAKNEDQFCFSSSEMYKRIESYIIDNYGEKGNTRFVIAPNDNPLACTCPNCTAIGNTPDDATPAVTQLVTRLAKRFPDHLFFTTYYLSTRKVPPTPLPSNAGVIISAMALPFRLVNENQVQNESFTRLLESWKKVTDKIYIWDYINNFDDYLTPFPILKIAQQRLRFFRDNGASGIFLNGSGYSYSAFDEMRTFVLSALLINPDLPMEELVRRFLEQKYHTSHAILYNYYISLENRLQPGKELNLYAGVQEAEKAYLNTDDFIRFYDELDILITKSKGEERKSLNKLKTALSFTRLELARIHTFNTYGFASRNGKSMQVLPQAQDWLNRIKEHKSFQGMEYYNESTDEIDNYINEWGQYILPSSTAENLLLGETPTSSSKLDEGYKDLSILTDGAHGLPSDYHCGWLISTNRELMINLPVKENKSITGELKVSFLHLPRHKIYVPQHVEVFKDDVSLGTLTIASINTDKKGEIVEAKATINLQDAKQLTLKITSLQEKRTQVAIDEVSFISLK